jgi:hypothetical protein
LFDSTIAAAFASHQLTSVVNEEQGGKGCSTEPKFADQNDNLSQFDLLFLLNEETFVVKRKTSDAFLSWQSWQSWQHRSNRPLRLLATPGGRGSNNFAPVKL